MLKILVCGISGKMGGNILRLAAESGDVQVICGVDAHPKDSQHGTHPRTA